MQKYKKPHLVIVKGLKYFFEWKNIVVLRAQEYGKLTSKEIESARKVIRRKVKRSGELAVRAYGYLPLMKKPSEVRMGKGKGNKLRYKVFPLRPGQIIFHVKKVPVLVAISALKASMKKLSVKTCIEFCNDKT